MTKPTEHRRAGKRRALGMGASTHNNTTINRRAEEQNWRTRMGDQPQQAAE